MTTATLTADQRATLEHMDNLNLGAVIFEGSYRFKEAFRRDAAMATRFVVRVIDSQVNQARHEADAARRRHDAVMAMPGATRADRRTAAEDLEFWTNRAAFLSHAK